MKKIIFIACLFTGAAAQAQIRAGSNRINKGISVTNTQPAGKINETTVQPPANSLSDFSKMKLKLPFSTVEKEYMVEKVGHFYVLNGDIIVGNDFPKKRSLSHEDKDYRWPDGVIPFVVDPSIFTNNLYHIVDAAITEFNSKTKLCLRHITTQKDYVKIVFSNTIKGAGLSAVGRQGSEQPLFLRGDASKGTVMHEILHAAGFYHEQCREDRDQFVRINEANIKDDAKNNFQVEEGVARSAYDYCSIMHYSEKAFSKNDQPTIECVQGGMVVACPPCLGNRETFSDDDIYGINWFYSNPRNLPCDPLPEFVPFPHEFPKSNPSASQAAMAAFRHRTDVAYKERHVSEFIKIAGAYPNMHEVKKGLNTVGGTVFLYSLAAQWQDVPLAELGNPDMNDFTDRMRATQVYAVQNGFIGGFPTFYHADYGKGVVCGTVLIRSEGAEWRDVPIAELGNPALDDIRTRMTSANDYAFRHGFLGGFPTFFHADYGRGIVCGIVLIKKSAGEWRDVVVVEGPR